MSIPDNPLAKLIIQDIFSANSAKATKSCFNTLFDIKNIANFYAIGFSFLLTC